MASPAARPARAPLTRAHIVRTAIDLADEDGIEALTMRRLGRRLGVKAMSLYNHVADKDDLLDGMIEHIASGFEVPTGTPDWRTSIRRSVQSTHEVLLVHPWASAVAESRANVGPVRLRLLEATVGVLTSAGLPMPVVIRTLMALDAHTYGFTLQEQAWPFPPDRASERAVTLAEELPEGHPNVAALMAFVATTEGEIVDFDFGLDLILNGLERLVAEGEPVAVGLRGPARRG